MATSELFQNLRKYTKGQIDSHDLRSSDPNLYDVRPNTTKGLSRLIFDFKDNDQFFRFLNVSDDDAWFAAVITNPYGDGYNFMDSSMVDEDFKNGYSVFSDFDEENKERLKGIMKIIDPAFDYSEFPDEDESKRAAEILLKFFEKETNRLVDDWSMEKEISANRIARDYVEREIDRALEEKGFKLHDRFDAVSIDVGHLIMLYLQTGKIWLNFKDLFKSAFDNVDGLGGWSDDNYEYYSQADVDSEGFNRDVSNYLDKIEGIIEEGDDYKKFVEMVERISQKFKPGVTYELPKLKDVHFRIKDYDRDEMKIVVTLRNKLKAIERKVSEENFYNLLYQPELFDFGFGNV